MLYGCHVNNKQQPALVTGDRCKVIAQFVNTLPLLNHPPRKSYLDSRNHHSRLEERSGHLDSHPPWLLLKSAGMSLICSTAPITKAFTLPDLSSLHFLWVIWCHHQCTFFRSLEQNWFYLSDNSQQCEPKCLLYIWSRRLWPSAEAFPPGAESSLSCSVLMTV
jgi:hypothetical protein